MPNKRNRLFRNLNDEVHLSVASRLKNGDPVTSVNQLKALYDEVIEDLAENKFRTDIIALNRENALNALTNKK